jgi:multidrug resistance efflux pump
MRPRYIVMLVVGLLAVIVGASMFGFSTWSNARTFVSTSNAKVVADLVQVGSANAGRITLLNVDVGDSVTKGQVIATVDIPAVISRSDITDTTKIGFRDVQDQRAEVLAPRSGIIVAHWAMEGDTVPAGQRIVTLMDPREIRVEANVSEGDINRVQLNQPVEVKVKSLDDLTIMGQVERIGKVTVASLLPEQPTSTNIRRSGQVVPVRINLGDDPPSLIPGSTAKIKIRTR